MAGKLVAVSEVAAFVRRCMMAVGTPEEHAGSLADILVAADSRGHYSHGLNRLEMYVKEVSSGLCDSKATPVVIKETPGTAFVDGRNGIGSVIGTFCMDLAVRKAKDSGVAWVCCTGSNHYGIAGFYSLKAMKEGLIGMSMTNTSPLVVPTRAKEPTLGTNPISIGAPGKNEDNFLLDMATCTVALGKVEIQRRKKEPIPTGWATDKSGQPTNDPNDVSAGGGLMPLGGAELTSGYKGYGLAMVVELLCGVLSGGPFGRHVRKWQNDSRVANLGQTFVALDPKCFASGFEERLQQFMDETRDMDPSDPNLPVLVAGDPERASMRKVKENGGIFYHQSLITAMDELAAELKVDLMKAM